ncbi:MAG: hypothetical protein LJF30_11985 [Acidobacteria bacterium]|nr:hypothetical protein [Acidobacteriota bacterium]
MKKNPFYGMSAAAMLFGCYMVSQALRPEPGHLGKLLTLIGVLQVYEALLVALGVLLVATKRAPRDGVAVLLIETLFLMDATLLATECVTAEVGMGTVAAVVLAALVVAKLMAVRRFVPELLPGWATAVLGIHAGAVLALPVAAALLAAARALDARAMYALWWLTLALPLARRTLVRATKTTTRGLAVWSWVPASSLLLHLWSVGWIHQVGFRPAFLAPFALGLALAARREELNRQVLLPAMALLLSVGQREAIDLSPLADGFPLSPLHLAALAAAVTWAVLAWRYRHPWLAGLAAATVLAGVAGPAASKVAAAAGALGRWVARVLPRDTLAWGVTAVGAAFVFLGIGTWTSLRGPRPPGRRVARRWMPRAIPGGSVTLALVLAALAGGALLSVLDGHPPDPAGRRALVGHAGWLCLLAAGFSLGALARRSRLDAGPTGVLSLVAAGASLFFLSALLPAGDHHAVSRNESRAIADVRTVVSAQAAYQAVNSGLFDADLSCLAHPRSCLPDYGADEPAFLDEGLASLGTRGGYQRSFHPGPSPEEVGPEGSPTSVRTWAYLATPSEDRPGLRPDALGQGHDPAMAIVSLGPGGSGVRSFCGDSSGQICFTLQGTPALRDDGTCDLDRCSELR